MNVAIKCFILSTTLFFAVAAITSCASHRHGVVCEEIEYRLNSMGYSPDQRAFMEEELRQCRADEERKAQSEAATRQSIYDRFKADTTKKDTQAVSVQTLMQDSSEQKTVSVYDRYQTVEPSVADTSVADTSVMDTSSASVENFQ